MQKIIHYRGGSNWNNMTEEYHKNKTQWIKNKIYKNEY
jgi:ribosomal protein L20A (L18A)